METFKTVPLNAVAINKYRLQSQPGLKSPVLMCCRASVCLSVGRWLEYPNVRNTNPETSVWRYTLVSCVYAALMLAFSPHWPSPLTSRNPPLLIFRLINFNAVSPWKTQSSFRWLTSFLLMSHHKPNVWCSHSNSVTVLRGNNEQMMSDVFRNITCPRPLMFHCRTF